MVGQTEYSEGTKRIIYEGECSVYANTSIRTFKQSNVYKGDKGVDIPGLREGIKSGFLLDYTDFQGTYNGLLVIDCYSSPMGTTLYISQTYN